MGTYLNPGNKSFIGSLNSPTYVDKSGIISLLNPLIEVKDQKYLCISRARRFGKTWTADMLKAYYSKGCDSSALFDLSKISQDPTYREHLNTHDTISLNIAFFYRGANENIETMKRSITDSLVREIEEEYPEARLVDKSNLAVCLQSLYTHTGRAFIFILDEWDHVLRETSNEKDHRTYINFLNLLFRDQEYVGLCYMTGILPIKKYRGQSSIGFFNEYSMISPGKFAAYSGFTEEEVSALCEQHHMDFELMKSNYDGYQMGKLGSVYCPLTVNSATQWAIRGLLEHQMPRKILVLRGNNILPQPGAVHQKCPPGRTA